jgi:hypothetical protein
MKKIKWVFLLLAFAGTACMMGIGIAVAQRSILGILASIIIFTCIMGIGFTQKKKMRENGTL